MAGSYTRIPWVKLEMHDEGGRRRFAEFQADRRSFAFSCICILRGSSNCPSPLLLL